MKLRQLKKLKQGLEQLQQELIDEFPRLSYQINPAIGVIDSCIKDLLDKDAT